MRFKSCEHVGGVSVVHLELVCVPFEHGGGTNLSCWNKISQQGNSNSKGV